MTKKTNPTINILVIIENGIVQDVQANSGQKIIVSIMDVDTDSDFPVSVSNWEPVKADIHKVIESTKKKFE